MHFLSDWSFWLWFLTGAGVFNLVLLPLAAYRISVIKNDGLQFANAFIFALLSLIWPITWAIILKDAERKLEYVVHILGIAIGTGSSKRWFAGRCSCLLHEAHP